MKFEEKISIALDADLPMIYINTYEEAMAENLIKYVLKEKEEYEDYSLYTWTQGEGLYEKSFTTISKRIDRKCPQFLQVTDLMAEISPSIFIVHMQQELIQDYRILRALRDVKDLNSSFGPNHKIFLVGPDITIPEYISKLVYQVDMPLPDINDAQYIVQGLISSKIKGLEIELKKEEFRKDILSDNNEVENGLEESDDSEADYDALRESEKSIEEMNKIIKNLKSIDEDQITRVSKSMLGLTAKEMVDALQLSLYELGTFDPNHISNTRIDRIKKTGVLDFIEPKATLDEIGGNDAFKEWIDEIKLTFSDKAKKYGIPQAKGHLALGIPGTSKTFSAEALAGELEVPLLKLSTDKIFSSLVGNSEKNIRRAFDIAKQCAPCILLIDEIEKTLSGIGSSNNSDAGTASRVFATVLENLNDPQGVYTVMTSNDITQLPPELTRIGRVDALWYFSLPDEDERREIAKIHVNKNDLTITEEELDIIVDNSQEFTGAEIEQGIINIKRKAFNEMIKNDKDSLDITKSIIIESLSSINPISTVNREKISLLENRMKGRVKNASKTREEKEIDVNSLLL